MTSYPPQNIYRVAALLSLVVTALFAWDLVQGVEAGSVLFLAVSAGVLAWSVRTAQTHVSLTSEQLVVERPFADPQRIDYGQILSVTEEGRMNKSLVIAYHPRSQDGLLDLERASAVSLPAVQHQDALYEELVRRAPL